MKKKSLFNTCAFVIALIVACCQTIGDSSKKPDKQQNIAANDNDSHALLKDTREYSSDVVFKWIDMQLRLVRTSSPFIGGLPPSRPFAYTSVALYEAVMPGMPGYRSLSEQLTDMPAMPKIVPGITYHWPTSANAALAAMNRNFFPNASAENKAAMDTLENKQNARHKAEAGEAVFQRSVQFGKAIAKLIFDWSKTDGIASANGPYTPPSGPGKWAPTPPAFAPAFGPYWGKMRLMVAGSLDGSEQDAPPTYSTDPTSEYYRMAKEVYDISQVLTQDQIALALYYRDNPGYGDGHYLSILKQILEKEKPKLDFAAVVLAKTGIACVDAGIGCWRSKFQHNQDRPIKYIREVLGHPEWNTLFYTPPFPDFPSGHSTIAGSFAEILKGFFGNNYQFTDHTYDYLGMPPRSYNSFDQLAKEIGDSRVYAGIHYRYSCEKGCDQGRKIGQNIARKLQFKKK